MRPFPIRHTFIGVRNDGDLTANCIVENTYYSLSGNITNGEHLGWTLENNVLICNQSGCYFFIGTASVKAQKEARVTFGLFIDDSVAVGCESPVYIGHTDKEDLQVCAKPIHINAGQVITVKGKSDIANNALTVTFFDISFLRVGI
jgi:hypothetical protein